MSNFGQKQRTSLNPVQYLNVLMFSASARAAACHAYSCTAIIRGLDVTHFEDPNYAHYSPVPES